METTAHVRRALEDVDVVRRGGSTVRVRAVLPGDPDAQESSSNPIDLIPGAGVVAARVRVGARDPRPPEGSRPRPSPTPARTNPDAAG